MPHWEKSHSEISARGPETFSPGGCQGGILASNGYAPLDTCHISASEGEYLIGPFLVLYFCGWTNQLWPQNGKSDGQNLDTQGGGNCCEPSSTPLIQSGGSESKSGQFPGMKQRRPVLEGGSSSYPCWIQALRSLDLMIYGGNRSQQIHSAHVKYFK